jgi:hypothetical protein
MKKAIHVMIVASLVAAPAAADVRPGECNPVLPVLDQTAQAAPADVTSQPAGPTAHARRRFLGLPLLLPLALLGGLAALGGNGSNSASPQ